LSDEKLDYTNVLEHRIPTINEIPIHMRQYRFLVIHKDEINKQVNELLEQEIVKPSNSPYNTPVWTVPKKKKILKRQQTMENGVRFPRVK